MEKLLLNTLRNLSRAPYPFIANILIKPSLINALIIYIIYRFIALKTKPNLTYNNIKFINQNIVIICF